MTKTASFVKGYMPLTGTVHYARVGKLYGREHLLPACGGARNARASLSETTDAVTCKRCLAKEVGWAAR